MNSSYEFLMSSLLAAENDPLPMHTTFEMISENDMPIDYRYIYQVIKTVWNQYHVLEPRAIADAVNRMFECDADRAELFAQLNQVTSLVMTSDFWQHYLELALKDIKLRMLNAIRPDLRDPNDVNDMADQIRKQIHDITTKYELKKVKGMEELCSEYLARIDDIIINGDHDTIRTHFGFEQYTKGFHPGDYVLLAARPKMGKSAVANAIIISLLKQGKRVMYVNNEMSDTSVLNRMIANISRVDHDLIQEPERMTEPMLEDVIAATDKLGQMSLNLYCMRFKTIGEVNNEMIRLREIGQPVDMVVIDYLQLFQASDPNRRKYRYDEISCISWEIKMLANDMKVPVLALSQLNRELEKRQDKRPMPSDLRDSGSLEQDATSVIFLYRDEAYNENSQLAGIGEMNVSINRNGKAGRSFVAMDFDHMAIGNLDDVTINEIKELVR